MIGCLHESLYSRFATPGVTSHRPRKKASRSRRTVCHFHRHHQALSQSATRERACLAQSDSWSPNIKGAALQADLLDQLSVNPDATREQHCQMWEARTGTKVSPASLSRARI